VKLLVWAHFKQFIQNQSHPRFRDYHFLQNMSTTRNPAAGELSILRCLHANDRIHGRAYWPVKDVLHVIPDYFGTQVSVFFDGGWLRRVGDAAPDLQRPRY
jgi:hypothetical protein